jgi:hypothetical protein
MSATTFDQIPAAISSTAAALERFEAAVYRADAVFQAEVAPRIIHAGIVAAHIFIQATIYTFIAGRRVGAWFWVTVDRYATPDDARFYHVTPDHLEPLPALPAFVPIALLPAAPERVLVTPAVLPSSESVLVTPTVQGAIARAEKSVARLNLGVRELRGIAKERGIKGAARMSKATLQALLAV